MMAFLLNLYLAFLTSNNYKSVAHAARAKLGERTEELYALGKISEEKYKFFRRKYEIYTESMKNYHH